MTAPFVISIRPFSNLFKRLNISSIAHFFPNSPSVKKIETIHVPAHLLNLSASSQSLRLPLQTAECRAVRHKGYCGRILSRQPAHTNPENMRDKTAKGIGLCFMPHKGGGLNEIVSESGGKYTAGTCIPADCQKL